MHNITDKRLKSSRNIPVFRRYCERSGVKKIRIHDIRHSHASMLIEMGIAPLAISERLGHEDIQTTLNTYTHLGLEDAADELSRLKEIENARNELAKLSGENGVFAPRIWIGYT